MSAPAALLGALEAVGAYRAGYGEEEMPELTHEETVALAGIASTVLDAFAMRGGNPNEVLRLIYAAAHGIPASSS